MSERGQLDGVQAAPAPDMPRAGKLTLRFPNDLETEFRASRSDSNRRWARMSLYVALSTTLGFAVIDHFVLDAPKIGNSDVIRFGLQLPMVLVMLVITGKRLFAKWCQPAVQIDTTSRTGAFL